MIDTRAKPSRFLRAAWTPEFIAGSILPLLVLPTAFNSGVNLLFLLGSLLISYMLLSVAMGLFNLKAVTGWLSPVAVFEEGQPIEIRAEASNPSSFSSYDVRVRPRLKDPVEPPTAYISVLPPGETISTKTGGSSLNRGIYSFDQWVVESPFPIGFMRTQRRYHLASGEQSIVVLPKLLPVDFRQAFGADQALDGEDALLHGPQGGNTYFGVREYRQGDPMRSIHWKVSARTQKLFVKEFQRPLQARYYLFLDLNQEEQTVEGPESNLEYLIRLAGSLGEHLSQTGALYHFVWYDSKSERVQVSEGFGRGKDLDHARTILAGLSFHAGSKLSAMMEDAFHTLTPGNRLVFFLPSESHPVPDHLAGVGFPAKAIFLVQSQKTPVDTEDDPGVPRPPPESGLAGQVDLYRYNIQEEQLLHELH